MIYGGELGGAMLFGIGVRSARDRWSLHFCCSASLSGRTGFFTSCSAVLFAGAFAVAGFACRSGSAYSLTHSVIGRLPLLAMLSPVIAAPLDLPCRSVALEGATPAGRKVMDEIEGFRQYLGVAEEDRLNYLHPPEKTPELFERYLPYAVALDVENRWAERFAGVLAAAAAAGAATTAAWYSGNRDISSDPARALPIASAAHLVEHGGVGFHRAGLERWRFVRLEWRWIVGRRRWRWRRIGVRAG